MGREGGQQVVSGEVSPELVQRRLGEPMVVALLARGLRWRLGQEEVVEQESQQRLVDVAARRPDPVAVARLGAAGDGGHGGVDQGVGRPGVIGDRRRPRGHHREVGDPPEVERGAGRVGAAEDQDVKEADERSALAAGRDIGAAEVGDDREPGALGDPGGPADLERAGDPTVRPHPVKDGLAVGDQQRRSRMARHGLFRGCGEFLADGRVEPADGLHGGAVGGQRRSQRRRQSIGVRHGVVPERCEPQHVAVQVELGGGGVDPVHRRARHEPDDDHGRPRNAKRDRLHFGAENASETQPVAVEGRQVTRPRGRAGRRRRPGPGGRGRWRGRCRPGRRRWLS
jgi:hypothetical protein